MRISKLRIENLRAFKDVTIPFDRYSCLIGANGSGKSTVLHALNIFFRESTGVTTNVKQLEKEDFHAKNTREPIKITVSFVELNSKAQEDFSHYFRQGELIICAKATFNEAANFATVEHFGIRKGIDDFRPFFEAQNAKAKAEELKKVYLDIVYKYKDLPPPSSMAKMAAALQEYEETHQELSTLIESSQNLYGFTKGTGKFKDHVQWIFVPAIKDVLDEQVQGRDTALGQILERTVQAKLKFTEQLAELKTSMIDTYTKIIESNKPALATLSDELQTKLREWAHPATSLRLEWKGDQAKLLEIPTPLAEIVTGEGIFEGKLARFGHGLQRSYLFALLQVLSQCDDFNSPTLILGCEEPELFQHPPQLRHLSNVFHQLSKKNSQILLCTHSPYFVSGERFEEIRLNRKKMPGCYSEISHATVEQIAEIVSKAYPGDKPVGPSAMLLNIHQSLRPEINEMFFAHTIVLVEGDEDLAYITTYLHLLNKWEEFRRLGCHIVPVDRKSNLIRPIAVAKVLKIPFFTVFDADSQTSTTSNRNQHAKDNCAIQRLLGVQEPVEFPSADIWADNFVIWKTKIGHVIKEELLPFNYETILDSVRTRYGHPGGIEKNGLFIADSLSEAWDKQGKSTSLIRLCENIMCFANRQQENGG